MPIQAKQTMAKKSNQKQFKLQKVPPISMKAHVITLVELTVVCAIWLFSAFTLFNNRDVLSMILLGVVFFLCVVSMYMVRAALESRRRYGKVDSKSCFYYSQMVQYDQKWSLWIGLSFFAVFAVGRWLFPSPNLDMTAIDIATSFYLGYIWTTKYKGEERTPFQYMETVFLLLVLVSNYIVYFI